MGTSPTTGSAPTCGTGLTEAELPPARHTHGLRHAHVSWQLAGGADLQIVKERLGHATITTTERCMHTLPGADEAALAALADIHRPRPATA